MRCDFLKNILLILTGGTIGSRIDENGNISLSEDPLLLKVCHNKVRKKAKFTVIEPLSVLSENMSLKDRETLIREILKTDISTFQGIIIAHGSDTLTYTASLCAMALRHINIPIVFIAADLVLSNPKSNGRDNFISAVNLICDGAVKQGCYICYKDNKNRNTVYLATRLCEAEPIFDSFKSVDGTYFGITKYGRFIYNHHPLNPSLKAVNAPKERIANDSITLKPVVSMLHSSPAFDYERYNTKSLSAILNYGYHSGTVDEEKFLPFAKECDKENIDIWLASFKDKDTPIYESLAQIVSLLNVHRLYKISPEAAYSKLVLTYSIDKKLRNDNLFFENL